MDQPTRNIAGTFNIAVRQQQPEFIPAQTRQHVAGAQHGQHQGRKLPQQGVARRVACGIVDGFEAIEIDKHQRMSLARLLHGLQQPLEVIFETDPVCQMGEGIVRSAITELTQHFARFGDVLNNQHRADILPVQRAERGDAVMDIKNAAGTAVQHHILLDI